MVVLVPTRELGVQTVMLAYKLWGGSVNPGVPGLAGNMFSYNGPRGMKARRPCFPPPFFPVPTPQTAGRDPALPRPSLPP